MLPELFDDADRLVAGDERSTRMELTGVLLVIGAAQAARLHDEEAVVGTDRREGEAALDEPAGSVEHESPGRPCVGHRRRTLPGRLIPPTFRRVEVGVGVDGLLVDDSSEGRM